MKTVVFQISVPAPEQISASVSYQAVFNVSVTASGPMGPQGLPGTSGITASTTPPLDPEPGQLWLDTSTLP